MAEQQIKLLNQRIQAQQQQFESYKVKCKELEEFLQQQVSKKQEQIRKLKEEGIKSSKMFNLTSKQLKKKDKEIGHLKEEIEIMLNKNQKFDEEKFNKYQQIVHENMENKLIIQEQFKKIKKEKQKNYEQQNNISELLKIIKQVKAKESNFDMQMKEKQNRTSFLEILISENQQLNLEKQKRFQQIVDENMKNKKTIQQQVKKIKKEKQKNYEQANMISQLQYTIEQGKSKESKLINQRRAKESKFEKQIKEKQNKISQLLKTIEKGKTKESKLTQQGWAKELKLEMQMKEKDNRISQLLEIIEQGKTKESKLTKQGRAKQSKLTKERSAKEQRFEMQIREKENWILQLLKIIEQGKVTESKLKMQIKEKQNKISSLLKTIEKKQLKLEKQTKEKENKISQLLNTIESGKTKESKFQILIKQQQSQFHQVNQSFLSLLKVKDQKLSLLQQSIQTLNNQKLSLITKLQSLTTQNNSQISQLKDSNLHLKKLQSQLSHQLQHYKTELSSLNQKYQNHLSKQPLQVSQQRYEQNLLQKNNKIKQLLQKINKFEQQQEKRKHLMDPYIKKFQNSIKQKSPQNHKNEERCLKLSHLVKHLKQKNQSLSLEKHNLLKKLTYFTTPQTKKSSNKDEQQQYFSKPNQLQPKQKTNKLTALILTKKHYVSPFMQIRQNQIKLYKSTKNSGIDKSLGYYKYKFSQIQHSAELLVDGCVQNITNNLQNGIRSSIIIFGAQKTMKKYIMVNIVKTLKDLLLDKINNSNDISIEFVKASQNQEDMIEMYGSTLEQAQKIIDDVVMMGDRNSTNKCEIKKKGLSKPKARVFKLVLGDQVSLQIITSSYTNLLIKQSMCIDQILNNVCYMRLPKTLQETNCDRQIILTLNPLVNYYENCKNTLALSTFKKYVSKLQVKVDSQNQQSIVTVVKQDLRISEEKKIESLEKQSQSNYFKVLKLQNDVKFYQSKFDQLQTQLKNLLNTHSQQNQYLKKSPISLSYSKMLKFVNQVQNRNDSNQINEEITQTKLQYQQSKVL